jgi:DNA-binding MarR family transcriptional regulator
LDVTASVLSKHLARLEAAGYVAVSKASSKGHLYTWASLTSSGRRAFKAHLAALRAIVDAAEV